MQLTDKKIILTGAASGIGWELLKLLAAYPVQMMVVDLDQNRLETTVQTLPKTPAQIIPYGCDVGQPEAVDRLFTEAVSQMGGVDLFIANAGFAYYEAQVQTDWARMEQIYRVNTLSPMYSAVKMRDLNVGRPYKVVITASTMGHVAIPAYSLYASTKAALHRFADAYRYELPDPSYLMLVYPIATRTNFFQKSATRRHPTPFPSQTPAYVAKHILRGIQRDQQQVYTSFSFAVYRFLERFFPPIHRFVQHNELRQLRRWLRSQG